VTATLKRCIPRRKKRNKQQIRKGLSAAGFMNESQSDTIFIVKTQNLLYSF
jgi:hypothetical protein